MPEITQRILHSGIVKKIAEGDKAVFQDILSGRHKGKLIESWCASDELRLMRRLSVIPEQFKWADTK